MTFLQAQTVIFVHFFYRLLKKIIFLKQLKTYPFGFWKLPLVMSKNHITNFLLFIRTSQKKRTRKFFLKHYYTIPLNLDEHKKLQNVDPNGTARHRRHRYNMIITMMFGVTALGAVLVPMGFQLLSVVSGKALLLAKMALLLASINGLKRVSIRVHI